MNCADCEQLFDAYLDGHLAGSLRLEFDAHRLRCRHCQQTLAMLEAIGNVVATDSQVPELSADFTSRVMRKVQPKRKLRPGLRLALVAGAVLQAAAVLAFVVMMNRSQPASAPQPVVAGATEKARLEEAYATPGKDALRKLILERVEERFATMQSAGQTLTSDLTSMAQYLNITVPDDVARESVKMAGVNPWQGFWDALLPSDGEEQEAPPVDGDVHSL